jgi:ribonuclease E
MFECQSCGRLDLNPVCDTCPPPAQAVEPAYELDDDLIVAEEVADDPFALELDAIDVGELALDIDEEEEADIFVVDESDDSDFEDSELDSDLEGWDDADIEFDVEDESEEDEEEEDEDDS